MSYRLYRRPQHGEHTVMGVDTSEGGDLSAFVVKSKQHCDSFLVFSGHYSSAELPEIIRRGYMFLKMTTGRFPWIGVERNQGVATINKLIEWKYPNLYKQKRFDERTKRWTEKIGWYMTMGNRAKLLDDLGMAVKAGETIIYDIETIDQMLSFVRNRRTGKPEGESGCFDDLVMAEGIALQLWFTTPLDIREAGAVKAVSPEKPFKTLEKGKEHFTYDLDELKKLKMSRDWRGI